MTHNWNFNRESAKVIVVLKYSSFHRKKIWFIIKDMDPWIHGSAAGAAARAAAGAAAGAATSAAAACIDHVLGKFCADWNHVRRLNSRS